MALHKNTDALVAIVQFRQPSRWRAQVQILDSFLPYIALWYAMYRAVNISYWLLPPLAILAAGFLVRIFIIFHDCGHGSFFKSRTANNFTGVIAGLVNLTPYRHWRWQHAIHHGTSGNLDRRGSGDIWTLTVQEYIDCSKSKRFAYRLARNPLVLIAIAPLYLFVIHHRFAYSGAPRAERLSVWGTNLALLASTILMSALIGLKPFLVIQIAVSVVAGAAGVWLFYVQHQFEGTHWARSSAWDYTEAALKGSSYYRLPRVLQWFTGNIGLHHVHHLCPRIPNYHLQGCHDAVSLLMEVKAVTLLASLKCFSFRLWDERKQILVGYRAASPLI